MQLFLGLLFLSWSETFRAVCLLPSLQTRFCIFNHIFMTIFTRLPFPFPRPVMKDKTRTGSLQPWLAFTVNEHKTAERFDLPGSVRTFKPAPSAQVQVEWSDDPAPQDAAGST